MEHKWKLQETKDFRDWFDALAMPPMEPPDAMEHAAWLAWQAAQAGKNTWLNDRGLATVLAALRYWQQYPFDPNESEIATDGGKLTALSDDEIDVLIERLNRQ